MSVFVGNIKKKKKEDEVSGKLAEALALFDSRSLDNYDTGFSSVPSSSTSGGRRPATGRTLDGVSTAGESSVDAYLANIDDFIGANSPRREGKASGAEQIPLVHFSPGGTTSEVR